MATRPNTGAAIEYPNSLLTSGFYSYNVVVKLEDRCPMGLDLEREHRRLETIVNDLCREVKSPQLLTSRSELHTELSRLRTEHAALRSEWELLKVSLDEKAFHPDQPRVPAGNRSRQSAAYCWNQMQIDMLYCASLRTSSIIAACRSQAMGRYAACLTGKPLPPLPF